MNPRERLIENIIDLVHARTGHAYDEALGDLLEATLKTHYAIGRWVPVEERLPDRSGCYLFVWEGGEPQWIDYTHGLTDGETPTHWLELNMPSGKGES